MGDAVAMVIYMRLLISLIDKSGLPAVGVMKERKWPCWRQLEKEGAF
jgi:hypothetical protein